MSESYFKLINQGMLIEGQKNEFKEDLNKDTLSPIKRTIIAFANSNGGKIFIGVKESSDKNSWTTIGIVDENKKKDRIIDSISNMHTLRSLVDTEIIEENGAKILIIKVQEGDDKPYSIKNDDKKDISLNNIFIRNNASNRIISKEEYLNMIQKDSTIESIKESFKILKILNSNVYEMYMKIKKSKLEKLKKKIYSISIKMDNFNEIDYQSTKLIDNIMLVCKYKNAWIDKEGNIVFSFLVFAIIAAGDLTRYLIYDIKNSENKYISQDNKHNENEQEYSRTKQLNLYLYNLEIRTDKYFEIKNKETKFEIRNHDICADQILLEINKILKKHIKNTDIIRDDLMSYYFGKLYKSEEYIEKLEKIFNEIIY